MVGNRQFILNCQSPVCFFLYPCLLWRDKFTSHVIMVGVLTGWMCINLVSCLNMTFPFFLKQRSSKKDESSYMLIGVRACGDTSNCRKFRPELSPGESYITGSTWLLVIVKSLTCLKLMRNRRVFWRHACVTCLCSRLRSDYANSTNKEEDRNDAVGETREPYSTAPRPRLGRDST